MTGVADATVGFGDPYRLPTRDAGSAIETSERETRAAALHELSERLTAATNYLAWALQLSKLASTGMANVTEQIEVLGKALKQLDGAGEIMSSLRKLLQEQEP